jgi:tRNA A37 threonylcarbamoyltransferase TsaD
MLTEAAFHNNLDLCLPPLWLTGDNAVMIAAQAFYEYEGRQHGARRTQCGGNPVGGLPNPAVFAI